MAGTHDDGGRFLRAEGNRPTCAALKGGSVSAGTADQIIDSIKAGKGAPARDTAVLMTWSPSQGRTPPAMSAELKTYLSKRGERKPDAVPVIIVIRHGNG